MAHQMREALQFKQEDHGGANLTRHVLMSPGNTSSTGDAGRVAMIRCLAFSLCDLKTLKRHIDD